MLVDSVLGASARGASVAVFASLSLDVSAGEEDGDAGAGAAVMGAVGAGGTVLGSSLLQAASATAARAKAMIGVFIWRSSMTNTPQQAVSNIDDIHRSPIFNSNFIII